MDLESVDAQAHAVSVSSWICIYIYQKGSPNGYVYEGNRHLQADDLVSGMKPSMISNLLI